MHMSSTHDDSANTFAADGNKYGTIHGEHELKKRSKKLRENSEHIFSFFSFYYASGNSVHLIVRNGVCHEGGVAG
jgi:hypothetical protein